MHPSSRIKLNLSWTRETALALALVAPVFVIGSHQAKAQAVASAKMHGTVTDSTGLGIPNAQVTATQTASGFTVNAVSDQAGLYTLSNLPVGPYSVSVVASGFSKYEQSGLVLQVSNDVAVNASLNIGGSTETVTVEANATQVQTEDNSITTVVDQQRTVDLPLNGRNAASLVLLSGSAAPTPNGNQTSSKNYGNVGTNSIGGALNISVAGGQGNQINYLLDGGDHNDTFSNVNMPFPFPDALQEFSVQTTGLQAQYGVHPSATVNVVTKSGSNQFHGGIFEFLRNNYANATSRLSPGLTSNLKRNQFGGFLGGPVLSDKLFFFGGYQHTALRITPVAVTANIPTTAMIAGNWTPYFQALKAASTTGTCPINSARLLAAGFATADATACTATVSPSIYSPAALKLTNYLPVAGASALGTVPYAVPDPQDENQWIGRLDYNLNSKHSTFARYFMTNYYQQSIFNGNLLLATNPNLKDRGKYLTLGNNYTITPSIVNAFRLTGSRLSITRGAPGDLISPATLGINTYQSVPNYIYINVTGGFTASCGTCAPTHFVTNHIQTSDDVSITHGKHFVQVGFDYIQEQLNLGGLNTENGQFSFSGAYSGVGLADLLLGAPSTYAQGNAAGSLAHLRYNYFGYYAQDTFRPTPKLVINAGLRWEPWFPEYEKNNVGGGFDMTSFNNNTVSTVFTNAPAGLRFYGDQGVSRGFINKRLSNFSPRLGFALDPTGTGRQSIRAAYTLTFEAPELYYDSGFPSNAPYASSTSFAPDNSTNSTDAVKSFDSPFKKVAGGNPFPTPYPPSSTVAFPAANISTQVYPSNLSRTYMHQYNASYQVQASKNWLFSTTYIGTHTVHLWGFIPTNYATPVATSTGAAPTTSNTTQRLKLYRQALATNTTAGLRYGAFSSTSSYGMANYNGAIFTINKRISNNYSVLANYTWSHCLSNINYTGDNAPPPQDPTNIAAEYSNCNFDVTHNLSLSGVLISPRLKQHLLNQVAGGWQLSPLVMVRTGQPFTVNVGSDQSLTGIGQDRYNVVPGTSPYAKNLYTPVITSTTAAGTTRALQPQWLNTAAFSLATAGTFGNSHPLAYRGPGFVDTDIAISKHFPLFERSQLEVRGEAFNLLNHPNYNNPISSGSTTSATFGKITSTANEARILQIAAKVTF